METKSGDFGVQLNVNKKKHGAEVHRGIKDTGMTVSGQQAHSEKVFCCGSLLPGSIETWNALLSLGFSYARSSRADKGSLHQEWMRVKIFSNRLLAACNLYLI